MNWTEILKRAGVPEPPGRAEALERVAQRRAEQEQEAAAAKAAGSKQTGRKRRRSR